MLTFGLFISTQIKMLGYTQDFIAERLTTGLLRQIDQSYVSRRMSDGAWKVDELLALSDILGSEDIMLFAIGRQMKPVLKMAM